MSFMQGQSEVTNLMAQIDAESAAAWSALYSPAQVGGHDFITVHYDRLGQLSDQLGRIVSEDVAIGIVARSLNRHGPQ